MPTQIHSYRRPLSSTALKHNPFDLLLGEYSDLAGTACHLPLERDKLFFLALRLVGSHHAAKQVTLGRPLTFREPFVLPRESRTYRKSNDRRFTSHDYSLLLSLTGLNSTMDATRPQARPRRR